MDLVDASLESVFVQLTIPPLVVPWVMMRIVLVGFKHVEAAALRVTLCGVLISAGCGG